jgi:hypothetical protein
LSTIKYNSGLFGDTSGGFPTLIISQIIKRAIKIRSLWYGSKVGKMINIMRIIILNIEKY